MVGDWGNTFAEAYAAATHAAKIVARSALLTTGSIVKNVAALARGTSQVVGEAINTVGGLTAAVGVSAYSMAVAAVSEKPPGKHLLVQPCPLKVVNVFNNSYRTTLVNSTFAGAGNRKLAEAMKAMTESMSTIELEKNLRIIAEARNRSFELVREEYAQFEQYRSEIEQDIVGYKLESIEKLKPNNIDFMASEWQLRYGKVVGDYMGIDPVFGALLNPTGGMVGPGNTALAPDNVLMPNSVAYHGSYHDAMGFIYQYQRRGNGYNYMKSPIGLDTSNPMAGQATGILQWAINLVN